MAFWNRRKKEDDKTEEADAPKRRDTPMKIYSGPGGTYVALKNLYNEVARVKDQNGQIQEVDVSGRVLNQVAFRTYVSEMERNGYDVTREKKVLAQLEDVTEQAGQTEAMEKYRMTGVVVGPFEKGRILLKTIFPSDMSGQTLIVTYPDPQNPGKITGFRMRVPDKKPEDEAADTPAEEAKDASADDSADAAAPAAGGHPSPSMP